MESCNGLCLCKVQHGNVIEVYTLLYTFYILLYISIYFYILLYTSMEMCLSTACLH